MVSARAQPSVQVVWEAPSTNRLLDSTGTALDSGLAVAGDGVVLELGYYDAGSAAAPFAGTFVPLTGASSPATAMQGTSVGDSGGGPNGTFSISTNFNAGTVVFQGAPPVAGTPLVIRFFDAKTIPNARFYNAVSGGVNWQWKVPTEAPGSFVLLSLADPGLVWLGGSSSSFRTTLACPVSFRAPSVAPNFTSVSAVVGGAVTLTPPERSTPATYMALNLPSGLRLNTTTGVVSGVPTVPGTYRVLVMPVNQSGVTETALRYNIAVAALSDGMVGCFSGLVERNSLNGNLGASLQITTTSGGSYSGKLVVGTRSFVLRGQLGISSDSPTQATISLPLTAFGPEVQLNLVFDGVSQTFSGTLSSGTQSAAISGVQSPKVKTALVSKLTGAYAFRLQQSVPVLGSPRGYGVGTLTVAPSSNTVSVLTTLADGARATFSTLLGKGGEIFICGRGLGDSGLHSSLTGQLKLILGTNAPYNNLLAGSLSWLKSEGDTTLYSAGFGPLSLDAAGGNLALPPKGGLVLGASPVSPSVGAGNANFGFSAGGLDVEGREFTRTVSLTSLGNYTNRVVVPAGTPTLTVSVINGASGAFSGSFVLAGTTTATNRTVRFQGQIVPSGAGSVGYGFFVMPALPSDGQTLTTSPKFSGSVLLNVQ